MLNCCQFTEVWANNLWAFCNKYDMYSIYNKPITCMRNIYLCIHMQLHILYVKQILVDIVINVPVINSFIQESRLTA